jgi:hypothetical protein
VEFSPELREGVLTGQITLTYRLWSRPQVKSGGQYRVGDGMIQVDAIELVPFATIDDTDLKRTGEPDLQSLRQRAAHSGSIHDDTLLFRIEFHVTVGPGREP